MVTCMATVKVTVSLPEHTAEAYKATLSDKETLSGRVAELIEQDTTRRAALQLAEDGWHGAADILDLFELEAA